MKGRTEATLDPADLIDISHAAAMVFVSEKTIVKWLYERKLTRFKVGGGRGAKTLLSRKELLGLIRKDL